MINHNGSVPPAAEVTQPPRKDAAVVVVEPASPNDDDAFPVIASQRELHMRRLEAFLDPKPRPGYIRLRAQAFRAPFFLLLCMVVMAFSLNFTNERMPDPAKWKQLPDIGFDLLPQTTALEHVTDLLLWTMNILNVLMVLALYVVHTREEQRVRALISGQRAPEGVAFDESTIHGKIWAKLTPLVLLIMDADARAGRPGGLTPQTIDDDDGFHDPTTGASPLTVAPPNAAAAAAGLTPVEQKMREWRQLVPRHILGDIVTPLNAHIVSWVRFWCTFSVMTIARSFVIVATVLPATNNHCQDPEEIKNVWWNAFLAIVTFGSGSVHCGDLLFSGHTATITVTFMSVWTYSRLVNWLFRPVALFCVSASWITIIASRSHYSDDVIIAFYCSVFTYIATRHDTRKGAPFWIQMFLYVLRVPQCCQIEDGNTAGKEVVGQVGPSTPAPQDGLADSSRHQLREK